MERGEVTDVFHAVRVVCIMRRCAPAALLMGALRAA